MTDPQLARFSSTRVPVAIHFAADQHRNASGQRYLSIWKMRMCLILLAALGLQAQRPEYDFYREGRDQKPEAYAEELRKAGVPAKEIARRLDRLRNHRTEPEADRRNRFYGDSGSQ